MNVDQPSVKSLNELALDDHHEASKGNDVWIGTLDGAKERCLKIRWSGVLAARYDGGLDVSLSGDLDPLGVCFIGDNVANPEAMLLLNQGLKVRTSAG